MKPSQIGVKKGPLVPQVKKSIASLAKLLGKMGIASISGDVEVTETPDGLSIFVRSQPVGSASTLTPFFVSKPYDSDGWKVKVRRGTLNGQIPVVGTATGTGGDEMEPNQELDITGGEPWVCLGVKTDLETRAIQRLTLQTVEDLITVVNTGARTRITYIPLAELVESVDPEGWKKQLQVTKTNLNYFTAGNSDFIWRA